MIFYIVCIFLLLVAALCAWGISVADFRRRIIPDAYLFPLMLVGLLMSAMCPFWIVTPIDAAIGAGFGYVIAAGIGFLFDYAYRRQNPDMVAPIGMGDIKLISVGGIWMGVTGLAIALVVACVTGIVWARVQHQKYIPFGPFFVIGGILALIIMFFLI